MTIDPKLLEALTAVPNIEPWRLEELRQHVEEDHIRNYSGACSFCAEGGPTIYELMHYIGEWSARKGWNDPNRTPHEWASLFHTEISEYYEEFRNGNDPLDVYYTKLEELVPKPEGQTMELADELIRLLHWFHDKGIDPMAAALHKMRYNETRGFRHGNKRA